MACQLLLWGDTCQRLQTVYRVEKVERQHFQEEADLQSVAVCSIAAVLASPGWQDFYLNVKVAMFFKAIGKKQSFPGGLNMPGAVKCRALAGQFPLRLEQQRGEELMLMPSPRKKSVT